MKKIIGRFKLTHSLGLPKQEYGFIKIEHIFSNIAKYQNFLFAYLEKVHKVYGFEDKFNVAKARLIYFIEENFWNSFKSKKGKSFKILDNEINEILKCEEKMKQELEEKMNQAKSFYELRFYFNEFKSKLFNVEQNLKNSNIIIPQFIKSRYFKEVYSDFFLKKSFLFVI
jgi:hypothetical protein